MAEVVGIFAAIFLLASSCAQDRTGQEHTGQGYALEVDGIEDDIDVGDTLSFTVQLRKDDDDLSVAANTVEVSAYVACGDDKSKISKAKADAAGKVTFASLQLDASWSGSCKINIAAIVDGQEVTTTHDFIIGDTTISAAQPGAATFVAGTERSLAELEQDSDKNLDGYLFLQNCDGAMLVALDGDDLHVTDSEGRIEISSAADWKYVVVGAVPSKCKLMHTEADITTGQEALDVVATPADSPGRDKLMMIRKSEHNEKIIVTTDVVSDGNLYVSNDGRDWNEVSEVKWGDITTTKTKWSAVGSDNHALLRVVHDGTAWWSLITGDITVGTVKSSPRGGKIFSIVGLGRNKKVKVKLTDNLCGIRVLRFQLSNNGNSIYLHAITTSARDLVADANGTITNFFAVNTPSQGCKLSFTIDGKKVTAVSTETTKSDIPEITMRKSSENSIRFVTGSSGRTKGAYILNGGVGSSGRSTLYGWLGTDAHTAMSWSTPANKNIVMVVLDTQGYPHVMYQEGS